MGSHCCGPPVERAPTPGFRRVLIVALAINAVMFLVEVGAGLIAGSLSLQADALDFLGDAGNYALTLFVLGMTLKARATAALVKGATMVVLGVFVLVQGVVHAVIGTVPHAEIMGATALTALLANAAVAAMLYRYRDGDSNARSVWLCSRNDVLANLAVLLAASGVFALESRWPDLAVAALIASLGLTSGWQVVRDAVRERRTCGKSSEHDS